MSKFELRANKAPDGALHQVDPRAALDLPTGCLSSEFIAAVGNWRKQVRQVVENG